MSKLLELKPWMTLDNAAKYLSALYQEEVSVADVLMFGLERHLTLSVDFVNKAKGLEGKVVDAADRPINDLTDLAVMMGQHDIKDGPLLVPSGVDFNNGEVFLPGDQIRTLTGIWDLTLYGDEKITVKNQYQELVGGPPVELMTLDGAFVENAETKELFQIQASMNDNPMVPGSYAAAGHVEQLIEERNVDKEIADKLREKYKEDRKEFLIKIEGMNPVEYHHPSPLPEDAMVVVRTAALRDFELRVNEKNNIPSEHQAVKMLDNRDWHSAQKLILGMAMAAYAYDPEADRNSATGSNNGSILSDLDRFGITISVATVRKQIKDAKKSVKYTAPGRIKTDVLT